MGERIDERFATVCGYARSGLLLLLFTTLLSILPLFCPILRSISCARARTCISVIVAGTDRHSPLIALGIASPPLARVRVLLPKCRLLGVQNKRSLPVIRLYYQAAC